MNDDADSTEYGLVMPFLPVTSKGGPHADEAYVAGFEMGRLDALLEHSNPRVHDQVIHAENDGQADLIAMRYGYAAVIEDAAGGWRHLWLTRVAKPS